MANPLLDAALEAIPLQTPPLKRAVLAVAFSTVLKIVDTSGAGIAGFQDRIRHEYPIMVQEQSQSLQFQLSEDGQVQPPLVLVQPVWRFSSKRHSWRFSLTREQIAIEVDEYTHRDDLLSRASLVLAALSEELAPDEVTRIGVRYVNFLEGRRLENIGAFINPQFNAFEEAPYSRALRISQHHIEFDVPEGRFISRWGILPPGATYDPIMAPPVNTRRYFLDLDAVDEESAGFSSDEIVNKVRALTDRVYNIFRSVVTEDLLKDCNA
ncbi:TIGR04255 family protein (plasmid) [Sphingomonas paeninsulae]|uniref:TIGR04255 family protein n=1 Tax=Sphingomonas paeninsulae TaxID=2319844 RepID=A0A494T7I8_SPHPE|nr:TIGR04255 family protein [Sphingomonas paeninsulae]AYJ85329.1 TIGR04255 family protein [Sphingomonas paeninsulae]